MNKYAEYVKATLDNRTLYEQLAEECSELSQASLKMIRANGQSNNFTPVTPNEALVNFLEEFNDVVCVMALLYSEEVVSCIVNRIDSHPKYKRWAKRLGYEDDTPEEDGD